MQEKLEKEFCYKLTAVYRTSFKQDAIVCTSQWDKIISELHYKFHDVHTGR